VDVDAANNVLVAGFFTGTMDIGGPAIESTHVTLTTGTSNQGFLAKIDPVGNVLWAKVLGSTSEQHILRGITSDAVGNIYCAVDRGSRFLVSKYTKDGAPLWTQIVSGGTGQTYYGGGTYVRSTDLAVDANSNVYVTGSFWGKIDFNPDPKRATTLTSAGRFPTSDGFVLKLNADGNYALAGRLGGRGTDSGLAIAVDGAGSVLLNGAFEADFDQNADYDPGTGKFNLPSVNGGGGGFVLKLDPNLNLIWGHSGVGLRMALDTVGNVYTTGGFSGTVDADPGAGTFNVTAGGEYDGLISVFNIGGDFVWAQALGTPATGITVDGQGNIYTTGRLLGTADFDPGPGTYSVTSTQDSNGNSLRNVFVAKLVPSSSITSTASATDAALLLFLTDDPTTTKRK
jgi:hypothetical protein